MGLDTISYCLVMEELGRADSSVRGIVSVQSGLVGKTMAKWGTDEQRERMAAAAGLRRGARLLRADGARARAPTRRASTTRAERDGDDWVLTGSKIFITLGTWAELALVFARSGEEGARGITCFLVPTGSEGFAARPIKGKLGLRAQDTGELFLEAVRVPDSARLGDEGEGFKVAMSALDNGRISLAAGCVGIAQGCLDASVAYAQERTQFGKPIAGFQLVQELLADISVEADAARLLTWRAAALADARRAPHARVVGREVLRQRGVRPRGQRGRPGARRVRLRGRVPGREVPARRARYDALRRHEPDPEADHRPAPDRRERLCLKQ